MKLVEVGSNREAAALYIRGGEDISLRMPIGTFQLRYAAGTNWRGESDLFGDDTILSKADKNFEFSVIERQVQGYKVELILQRGGNLQVRPITRAEF